MEGTLMQRGESIRTMVRWRLRGRLSFVPAYSHPPKSCAHVAYLFAGTYGDFVQALPSLRRLASAYPGADIILAGAGRYAREFAPELPVNVRLATSFDPWRWIAWPVDLLLTNAVGVYRVRFDFAARFCARRAYGFRHKHEDSRGGYTDTIKLDPGARNFAEENGKLLDLARVPAVADGRQALESQASWGKGKILFHIGSAGLKSDFGLKVY